VSFSTNKGIGCYGASPVIQACEFDSSGIGIACEQNSSPNISGCTFSGNYGYGIWINDARPEVSGNNFQGNAKQAVKVKQRIQAVSCENNYWGHETGPYHSLNNPQGQGDGVGDFILFTPWAQVPF
jgi:parallel beta-helix repeat protein